MSSDESLSPGNLDSAGDQGAGHAAAARNPDTESLLAKAREQAAAQGLKHAGGILPAPAWQLIQGGIATLIDVRTAEERKFVGHIPAGLHVAWATGTSMTRNPRFVREVEAKVKDKNALILLLCRSGRRSVAAGEALTKGGFTQVFNILEGFEGELDADGHRGTTDGWRHCGLPWLQD
jgi:rhodanese-related sulfurtransferase